MPRPYVITVSSEKGGVGKTTLATNLAVYLKALAEDLPITLFSFDNHFTVDRMFRLSADQTENHVGHLFDATPPHDLVRQGEYGVNIIPSCRNLAGFNSKSPSDRQLADILAHSGLGGVVIIDTCPVLDPYTRNALYAADRVIVPIKDAPSLENCQHLAHFFTDHGISRALLRLLPCLIDTRIRYNGPFKDSYQLLKAYAINRGYRCLEGYIAKSPKVESLATNPEGKVYPVLTHGRNTEVHLQFTHLARQVYLEYLEKGPHRLGEINESRRLLHEVELRREQERKQCLIDQCLCCGCKLDFSLLTEGFYVESAEREVCGYIEVNCFYEMVFNDLYDDQKFAASTSARELFRESAQRSYFLLQRLTKENVLLVRLDENGETLSRRECPIRPARGLMRRGAPLLNSLLDHALPAEEPNRALLLRLARDPATNILQETPYARFQAALSRARLDIEAPEQVPVSVAINPTLS